MNVAVMNVAARLSLGQSVEIGDVLVAIPSGFLRIAANIRTGIVYSTNLTTPFFLGHHFVLDAGGLNVFTFTIASVAPDGTESRSQTVTLNRLSATSLTALQDFVRNNALMLFNALGFPQFFYVVGEFERHDNTFPRVSGIIVRMHVPANDTGNGATTSAD